MLYSGERRNFSLAATGDIIRILLNDLSLSLSLSLLECKDSLDPIVFIRSDASDHERGHEVTKCTDVASSAARGA